MIQQQIFALQDKPYGEFQSRLLPTIAKERIIGVRIPVMRKLAKQLTKEEPEAVQAFVSAARQNGFGVIIAAAGKAAHLAGVLAAGTTLPVIGIPMKSSALDGMDALLSTVQMPPGIPVATVAIDGAVNAALLAAEILAVSDDAVAEKLAAKREAGKQKVLEKNRALEAQYPPL